MSRAVISEQRNMAGLKRHEERLTFGKSLKTELISALLVLYAGLMLVALYETGSAIPLPLSLALATSIFIFGFFGVKLAPLSLLPRYALILYSLPFIHLFESLFTSGIEYSNFIWGLTPNPYNRDIEIVKRLAMVATVGLSGLVTGFSIARFITLPKTRVSVSTWSLKPAPFIFIAALSVGFSWLYSPADTIMTASYTKSASIISSLGINFNAAWLLSYQLAALLLIDSQAETNPSTKRWKLAVTFGAAFIIVVWFQFMRGDRECIGLIFAFAALLMANSGKKMGKQFIISIAGLALIVAAAQVIGFYRESIATYGFSNALKLTRPHFLSGTWTAALMTPLSVVGDFYYGLMKPLWGQTYVDYYLSLSPGFITQLFGTDRPIEGTHGPAWAMRYGLGGTDIMVVPFMNFKSAGLFIFMTIYGALFGKLERAATHDGVGARFMFATIFIIGPFWFWYGDMYIVRALMGFLLIMMLYLLLPKASPAQSRVRRPLNGE